MPRTPQLYDDGEEDWSIKLHLGCGGVYLEGYVNLDVQGILASSLKTDEARVVNATSIMDYYARLEGNWNDLPIARPVIVDAYGDMASLPYPTGYVDKIVAIQSFEHLTPAQAWKALSHWHTLLHTGGVLILSVPDMAQTLEWVEQDERRSFALRHLRGSLKSPWSRHYAWYTAETLTELLAEHGFAVQPLLNFHVYPSVVVRAVRQRVQP